MGTSGKREKKSETLKQARTQKTEIAVDHHQNNRMLRQCPLGIAQQLVYYAVAFPTAIQNSHKDNVSSFAIGKQLKQKKSNFKPSSTYSLLLISSGLTCGFSTTSLLLISPRPAKVP